MKSPAAMFRGMDWRLFAATFGTVFLAELGDKTQLATLTFAASGKSRMAVFAGSALALVLTSAVAVLAGATLTRVVSPTTLQRAAGVAFLAIGTLVLWSSRRAAA